MVLGLVTMFGVTLISEHVNDRSLVSMAEDIWALPFLVALYCLPEKPNQWVYFVSSAAVPCFSGFIDATGTGNRLGTSILPVRTSALTDNDMTTHLML